MKRYLRAAGAFVGSAVLVVSSLLVTATAAHADATGTLVVNVVDQYNRPTAGFVELMGTDGTPYTPDGSPDSGLPVSGTSATYTLPAGGYAAVSITPWSGYTCVGVSSCTFGSGSTYTPAISVTDGAQTVYTMHVTVPSITGSGTVGAPLTIQIPPGLSALQAYGGLAGVGGLTQQWVRGATDIAGATSSSYTTVPADGSHAISARLTPAPGLSAIFLAEAQMAVAPLTTNAIAMRPAVKVKTKTKIKVAQRIRTGERASVKVKVKAAHRVPSGYATVPSGYVTVKIGKFKKKKALQHGSVFVTLPSLRTGTYKITAKYGGASSFATSKAKKAKLVVRS